MKSMPDNAGAVLYQVLADSHNNLWMADIGRGHLGRVDAKTGETTWYTPPTPNSGIRRMSIDDNDVINSPNFFQQGGHVRSQDRNVQGVAYAGLDPPLSTASAKTGEIWTGGMETDRVVRLDPKTGKTVEYLMPSERI